MISVPSLIRDYLREDSHKKNIRIHFPNYERTDICNDQIVINTVQFTESLCSQNKLKFGLCEAPMFECEVVGVGNITGAIIEVSCEIYCPASVTGAVFRTDLQAYVYPIPYGTFTVTEAKRQSDMNHRKITAYGGPAAIDWKPYHAENQKRLYAASSESPVYDPNLAYIIAEKGIDLFDGLMDRTEIPWTYWHEVSWFFTAQNTAYKFQIYVSCNHYVFAPGGVNDYDALYVAENGYYPECTPDYLYSLAEGFFSEYDQELFYKRVGEFRNGFRSVFDSYVKGLIKFYDDTSMDITRSVLSKDHSFYPYVNSFYDSSMPRACRVYVPYLLTFTAQPLPGGTTIRKDISLCEAQGSAKLYKYKFKADAPAWTSYRLSVPTSIAKWKSGSTCYFKPDFSDIDLRELCGDIAELLGTIVSFTRDGFEAKFIDIKQLFSLLPSGTLYPGQQLYPGATTGGKLYPKYYQSCWYQDEYEKPFGKVECKYKDTNNKECVYILYIDGFNESSDESSYKTYEIENNAIISGYTWTEAQIQAICETIADNIAGVTYMPVEFTGMGYPYVESGDTFEILTPNNDSIVTIVLNRTLSGEQVLTDTYKSV